ncbi:MAG: hypothetical protein WCH39_19810 [Schlesneria sp.]
MPDPKLYLLAMAASAIASLLFVLVATAVARPASSKRLNIASILGISFGLAVGYNVLALRLAWPPVKGLDRFLLVIAPATIGIELIAGFSCIPRFVAWLLRICLAVAAPPILLQGSVYLRGSGSDQDRWQSAAQLVLCSVLLIGTWRLLTWLSARSPGISIPLALAMTIQSAGLTIMMAGYIKGGAATIPLAAALVGTTVATELMRTRTSLSGVIGIGVVGLFGILFIGRFFGRLSTVCALTLLLAPLLLWVSEMPFLRHQKPWLVASLKLLLVAIPLAVVLVLAKQDFDLKMAPLL